MRLTLFKVADRYFTQRLNAMRHQAHVHPTAPVEKVFTQDRTQTELLAAALNQDHAAVLESYTERIADGQHGGDGN